MHSRINPVLTIAVLGVLLAAEVIGTAVCVAQGLSADTSPDSRGLAEDIS